MVAVAKQFDHERFDRLEAEIAKLPPVVPEVVHHFDREHGIYAREMRILPGTVLTGKEHKGECLNVVCGDISVFNAAEGTERRIRGYEVFVSPGGTRRAGFAHAFTVWTTIHKTEHTDLAKIEAEVIVPRVNPLLTNQPAGELS